MHACSDVGSLAKHLAHGIDDHRPAIEPDPGGEPWQFAASIPGVRVLDRAKDRQSGAGSAFGVILLGFRISEERHEPVAEPLGDMAAVSCDRLRGVIEVGADEVAPVLGIERRCKACRPDQIAEHHCDGPSLRFVSRAGRGNRNRRRSCWRRESGDRFQEASAVAERQAELFEVVLGQLGNDIHVDQVIAKRGLVPFKTQTS